MKRAWRVGPLSIWSQVAVLSVGGALGVNARYWLTFWMNKWIDSPFPWATVTINVTGSFAIGFLAVILAHHWDHQLGRLFVVTGFLGGYTTFSSFAYESLKLWEDGRKTLSTANTVGSVTAGIVAVVLGVMLARALIAAPLIAMKTTQASGIDRIADDDLPSEAFLEEGQDG